MDELSNDQKIAYNYLRQGENVFVSGEAGTGKSYVINKYITDMERENKNIIVCAPTGIAAINVGGVTIHRCFEVSPEPLINQRVNNVPDEIKAADIIIIDEISMCRIDLFDYVIRVISRSEEMSLKRKQIVVVGDFFQLPPVTTKNDYNVLNEIYPNYDKGFAFQSTNWQDLDFKMIILKEPMRQSDNEFIKALNQIRIGNKNSVAYFNQHAKKEMIEDGIVLCSTNKRAQQINDEQLNKLESNKKIFKAIISGDVKSTDKPTLDEIHLKVNARVIILINDTENFLYQNGSLGIVTKIDDSGVEVTLDHGKHIVVLNPYEWVIENYTLTKEIIDGVEYQKLKKQKVGSFTQIPLKLAYAITIHKSQGQTYDKVNLIPRCFDCGQLYVALSRVKSMEGLCLLSQMRQEDLICHEGVKAFYQIKNKPTKKELLAKFGNMVLNMPLEVQNEYPNELKLLINVVKNKLNS